MREFLEDANAHREDGAGRAQAAARPEMPKRFYSSVSVVPAEGGYGVALDGRVPRTPGMKAVVAPRESIALAQAKEWQDQRTHIDFETMPLTRLVNSAVEVGPNAATALRDEVLKYAASDLLLYRADHPESLMRRQEDSWDAALVKLARHFEISFQPTMGIVHQPQPAATLRRLGESLDGLDHFRLAALNAVTTITGSGLLSIALGEGLLNGEEVWSAAHVDEDFNIGQWGEVSEITERRAKRRRDYDAAVLLLTLLNG